MWAVKILNGPQSGKIFPLQKGNNVVGRSNKADIKIADNGISKSHAQIFVTNDKVIISDLKSQNGTFVNGVKVQNHGLKTGDKILVNETIFTVFQLPDNVVFAEKISSGRGAAAALPGAVGAGPLVPTNNYPGAMAVHGANALAHSPQEMGMAVAPQNTATNPFAKMLVVADNYIDEVALPPVYKSVEKMDFKYVLFLFTLGFIFLTTFLAIFPLSHLTKESVMGESKRRALTLARNLAQMNRKALAEDSELSLTTDFIARESGVEKAMILSSKTGAILAPPNMMGRYLKDPYILALRNGTEEKVDTINDKQLAAAVPVRFFNPDIGEATVGAYAIVVYNIDPLAVDFGRTLSLFIQIFLIACVIGAIIYFVQYRLIIHPIDRLNKEIDRALSEGSSNVHVPFKFPIYQDLISNINSALSRISSEFTSTDQFASAVDKTVEASELVKMFPIPAFALDPVSKRFIAFNSAVEGHPLFEGGKLMDASIEDLTDRSLYESLKDLLNVCVTNPNNRHSNILPSQGVETYEIMVKAMISGNKTSYLIFTIMQVIEEDEA